MSARAQASTLLAACLAAALALPVPTTARADGAMSVRRSGIALKGNALLMSIGVRDAFSKRVRKKLPSGLPTRLVVQVNLEREGSDRPLSYWVRTVDVVYDLWEERYVVTVEDDSGRRKATAPTIDAAVALAATIEHEPVADITGIPPGNYRLRVHVEVNPVSAEMVENIRRWLARPSTGDRGARTQSSFFGSFVGKFVDHNIGKADRTFTFVTQWFGLDGTR
jgi:hypothetical protein